MTLLYRLTPQGSSIRNVNRTLVGEDAGGRENTSNSRNTRDSHHAKCFTNVVSFHPPTFLRFSHAAAVQMSRTAHCKKVSGRGANTDKILPCALLAKPWAWHGAASNQGKQQLILI